MPETLRDYKPYFVLIIDGRRMFQCFFRPEVNHNEAICFMEGYTTGLGQLYSYDDFKDEAPEYDHNLQSLIMW